MPSESKMDQAGRDAPAKSYLVWALVIPLVIGLVFFLFPQYSPLESDRFNALFLGYCVAMLSFFAGTRHGIYLNQKTPGQAWLIPFLAGPVLGIIVFLLPFPLALAVLIAGFGAHGAWDSWDAFHGKLPRHYAASRITATWLICVLLIGAFVLSGLQ